jgi:SAM-dependent methyltransferase
MTSDSPKAQKGEGASAVLRYLATDKAYDLWSEVYDTDGNFLQALDTIEMKSLLPTLIDKIISTEPWKFVDLGCGTGRNTTPLLQIPHSTIIGLDLSSKMLDLARSRLSKELNRMKKQIQPKAVALETFNMIHEVQPPSFALGSDAVISTLVLEHVPLDAFLETAYQLLKTEGLLLVTNMHSEMGGISQAGFRSPQSGEKIRPLSYAHSTQALIEAAILKGFTLEGDPIERAVNGDMLNELGPRAKKWLGVMVWYGMIFRKIGRAHLDGVNRSWPERQHLVL